MATFRQLESGYVQAIIRKKGHPAQSKTFPNRKDAEDWVTVTESEMIRGTFILKTEAESTTLGECLERYSREVTPTKKGASKELSVLRKLQADELAKRFMASIRGADLAKFRDKLLAEGYAAATVGRHLAVLSHVFNTAIREWRMESLRNPVGLISKPKIRNARDRRLTEQELEAIIHETESRELPAIIRLLTETAMRRGELAKLEWKNVDLKRRLAFLYDTKNPKGGQPENRVVPLSTRAAEALQGLPRRIDGKVFGMTPDAITKAFSRACKRLGIEGARIHDLRHEATSRLFESGKFDMMEVASITGHKTMSMLKRYTHLKAEELAKKLG